VLSFIGLIHGEQVAWAASPGVALGYLFAALVCLAFSFGSTPAPAKMPDEHSEAPATIPHQTTPAKVAAEPAH
jgi:adenine/guanine/hypoxanthine permease